MLQLKDLASKKFQPVIGEKYYSDSSGIGEHFTSKQSFGIRYTTGITTYNLKNPFVQKNEPFLHFFLYLGIDTIRAQVQYLNLIYEFDKCLIPLGFEKKVEIGHNDFDYSVFIKEITEYHSESHHTRFRIILSNPTLHEAHSTDGSLYEYPMQSELIEVNVFYYE